MGDGIGVDLMALTRREQLIQRSMRAAVNGKTLPVEDTPGVQAFLTSRGFIFEVNPGGWLDVTGDVFAVAIAALLDGNSAGFDAIIEGRRLQRLAELTVEIAGKEAAAVALTDEQTELQNL